MQPSTKTTVTQAPQRSGMSAGWKIVFGILGGVLLLAIVSYVVMQVYYALAGLNGWSTLETQWLALIWLLSMVPAGLVALVGLAIAYPIYRVQRAQQPRHQDETMQAGEVSVLKERRWARWLVILGLISFSIPLVNIVSVYLESSYDIAYITLGMFGLSIVASVVQLVFVVLSIMYILFSNAPVIKKSIVGAAVLGIILLIFVGIPAFQDAYYNETDTHSETDSSYYDDSTEYYDDEYAQ